MEGRVWATLAATTSVGSVGSGRREVLQELWAGLGKLLESLWEALAELCDVLGGSGGALGELWQAPRELLESFVRLLGSSGSSERVNLSKNSRSTAPVAVMLIFAC